MKLSFAVSSSKPPKPSLKSSSLNQSSSIQKQFVTEFDPSKPVPDPNSKNTYVIAPKSNEWQPHKKLKNIDLPVKSDDPNLQFEVANSSIESTDDPNITYGLNIRTKKDSDSDHGSKPNVDRVKSYSSIEDLMLNKFRNDIDRLPEDNGFDEFKDVAVEDFASALLRGYGWVEGRGIGKNAKEDVKVVEYTKRTGKEGLGFVNDMPMPPTKDINSNSNSNSNNKVAKIDTKTRKESVRNEEKRDHKGSSDRGSKRKDESNYDKSRSKRGRQADEKTSAASVKSWLTSRIRVKVISERLKRGRLYLQKGEIVDVVGRTTCDISMDKDREIIQGVDQELLETVLPKRGGPVLVLYGKHKGVYGTLQEKDMDSETAVVRDADTHALINVNFDQIAEYVGDPDDFGY
ncbi:protein MOS2-like [Rutidosis leptorrhynchoides]|uniref:protein MOS2-like n=1 Tax=Rutidosis leptorrhynchoides TaxID=125765 RepID=UPI003A9A1F78